jgi:hypothetical protein
MTRAWRIPTICPTVSLAREIVESLKTALEQFRGIENELEEGK